MTTTPWSWLHSVAVPALLAAVSATWVAAWLGVSTHLGHRSVDLAWPDVAVPAVVAVVVASSTRRLLRGRAWSPAVLAVLVVAGVALTAGVTAAGGGHGALLTVAFHPWDLRGTETIAVAKLDWGVAVVAWAGGVALGRSEVGARRATAVAAVAAAMLGVFLLVGALAGHGPFHSLARGNAILLVVDFPAAGAAIALAHERELERTTLRAPAGRPGGAWLVALGLPLGIVALLAVVVALAVGSVAPYVGRAIRQLVVWAAEGIAAVLDALIHLVPASNRRSKPPPSGPASRLPMQHHSSSPLWVKIAAIAVGIAALGFVVWVLARALLRLLRRLVARARPPATEVDEEEVDSLFSWAHLVEQLLGLFGRLGRRRTAPVDPAGTVAATDAGVAAVAPDSVRAYYLSLLRSARAAGRGRSAAETPLEMARRLAGVTHPAGASGSAEDHLAGGTSPVAREDASAAEDAFDTGDEDLQAVTSLYDDVRYGGVPDAPATSEAAGRHVAAVTARLAERDGAEPTRSGR